MKELELEVALHLDMAFDSLKHGIHFDTAKYQDYEENNIVAVVVVVFDIVAVADIAEVVDIVVVSDIFVAENNRSSYLFDIDFAVLAKNLEELKFFVLLDFFCKMFLLVTLRHLL